jgi:peroxiredoxin
MSDFVHLPPDLPAPEDDGAAAHLPGLPLPDLRLPSTDGDEVALTTLGFDGRAILYCYPMTGRPGSALPTDWDLIPGARGCTPEACGFRDHHRELLAAGVSTVHGVSSQDIAYQQEAVDRLELPFAMLSDPDLRLAAALRLPTFSADGIRLYTRLTMVVREARIEHVFYPVFPPDRHADEVLAWLRQA